MVLRNLSVKVVRLNNVVVWDNASFRGLYRSLSKGYASDMGCMLALSPTQKRNSHFCVGIRYGHHRSAAWLEDTESQRHHSSFSGNANAFFWRDVNLKGVGRVSGDGDSNRFHLPARPKKIEAVFWLRGEVKHYDDYQKYYTPSQSEVRGLLDYVDAYHDSLWAEQLYALGIRTHRTLGIIVLKELVTNEGVKTIEFLQEKELVPAGFMPVVQVRAFGTVLRVGDLEGVTLRSQQEALSDVYQLISEELGINLSYESYLEWFAITLGENLGRLHQAGLVHGSINPHNVTLDCRLVDHDTMTRPQQHVAAMQYEEAFGGSLGRTAEEVLRKLCVQRGRFERFEELASKYKQAYQRFVPVMSDETASVHEPENV